MRYFKVTIAYQLTAAKSEGQEAEQVLYCCSPTDFPKDEQLRELFYSLDGHDKTYKNAFWKQIREDEITTDEVHLI